MRRLAQRHVQAYTGKLLAPRKGCAGARASAPARILFVVLAGVWIGGCAQGLGGGLQPPPPPQIGVTVSPTAGMVWLGNSTTFMATVTNTSNTAMTWSVNGVAGGSAASGTVTATDVYTAPADLPSPASVQVTATSVADPTKAASAAVTVTSDIVVQIAPNVAKRPPQKAAATTAGTPQSYNLMRRLGTVFGLQKAPASEGGHYKAEDAAKQKNVPVCPGTFWIFAESEPLSSRLALAPMRYCVGASSCVKPVVFTSRNSGVRGGSNNGLRKLESKV
jgi:hypothetical protein